MARKLRRPEHELLDAALEAEWPVVFDLLGTGAKPTAADREGRTALHYAAADGLTQMANLLLRHGARAGAKDLHEITPLHFAVKAYAPAVARALLAHNAAIDSPDHEGNTPLHYAVAESFGRTEMIRTLLQIGADPHLRNRCGQSPIDLSRSMGTLELTLFLRKAA